MRMALILGLILALGAGCATGRATPDGAELKLSTTPAAATAVTPEPAASVGGENEVPAEFRDLDFKNISYPYSVSKRPIKLEGGRFEFYQDEELGSGWLDLESVHYADVTGDGRAEAVVRLSAVLCGGSCDGGSNLFYFYSAREGRPKLLWRLETGSLGYGCGLKSFAAGKGTVVVEVFKKCRFDGESIFGEDEREPGEFLFKFSAKSFTRFQFEFDGRRFALKDREVFPNPQENVKNYSAPVSISDE